MLTARARSQVVVGRVTTTRDDALDSSVHDDRTAAVLGIALGVAFTTCFATGLLSHLIQHPPSWFEWTSRPAGLYRITQGVHVATGLASIPLLFAKLWSVYPRLFQWPPVKGIAHAVERLMLVPLVCGSVFMLFSGASNVFRWYPWQFFFPRAHYWAAWITIGALVAHIGAKVHVTRAALSRTPNPGAHVVRTSPAPGSLGRRGFIGAAAAGAGLITLTTVGQTVGPLARLAVFAPRDLSLGPQGLPVNQAAVEAGVIDAAQSAAYRLRVTGAVPRPIELTLAQVEAMPRREAQLPIACVEGWSKSAHWRGIPVQDVLAAAGVPADRAVEV